MQRCLEKDRRQRLRDIGDALPELAAPWSEPGGAAPSLTRTRGLACAAIALVAARARVGIARHVAADARRIARIAGSRAAPGPIRASAARGRTLRIGNRSDERVGLARRLDRRLRRVPSGRALADLGAAAGR